MYIISICYLLLSYNSREFLLSDKLLFNFHIKVYRAVTGKREKCEKFKCQNECVEVENSREGSLDTEKNWYKIGPMSLI